MSGWYWRDGTLALPLGMDFNDPLWLTQMLAIEEKLSDTSYRVIRQETLDTGYLLSTVWLGLDHQHGAGPPLIFETMLFSPDVADGQSDVYDQAHYATEAEAREGHERMKIRWSYPAVALKDAEKEE